MYRDEVGLTAIGWLLIVAAVAGLAALAVVLVQGQVEVTADELGAEPARVKSAEFEAAQITDRARGELSEVAADNDATAVGRVNERDGSKCDRLAIVYQGLGVGFAWHDAVAGNARPSGEVSEALCEVVRPD